MDGTDFVRLLTARGYDFFTGVPCSWFKGTIEALRADTRGMYAASPDEAAAVGMAAGASLAGRNAAVLMQNNGLMNCLDVVSSLVQFYRIPLLMLVSWRGYRNDDFEEHHGVGKATRGVLKSFDIPVFTPQQDTVEQHLKVASFTSKMARGPAVLLIRKGVLE